MNNLKPTNSGNGAKTNRTKNSLIKTLVFEDAGKWVKPNCGELFYINENGTFPNIDFEIEAADISPFEWSWNVIWPAAVSGLKESMKRGKVIKIFSDK